MRKGKEKNMNYEKFKTFVCVSTEDMPLDDEHMSYVQDRLLHNLVESILRIITDKKEHLFRLTDMEITKSDNMSNFLNLTEISQFMEHAEVVCCKDCRHNGSFDTDCPITWNGKRYCNFGER